MLKLLIKAFVRNSEDIRSPKTRAAYGTLCAIYGIFWNLLLFAGKYFAGVMSGSVAIMADAFNNLSDAGSSIISLLGFALAAKKPDSGHPYGHGRLEYLSGLVISLIIIVMGFELAKSSVEKIISPQLVQLNLLSAAILFVSILVKIYLSLINRKIGKMINSTSMKATATDSLSDAIATSLVLISMAASWLFGINVDGYAGLVVAVFIMFAGFSAAKDTLSPLLGQAPDEELVRNIEETVTAYPEICGIHDLMVHDYGPGRVMVSLHAEVNGSGDIFLLHDAIDSAELELKARYGCLATIHMDPIEADNTEVMRMRTAVAKKLAEHYPGISIHDFRMIPGPTHTNLVFDALVPMSFAAKDEELSVMIEQIVNQTWENHFAIVCIDRGYL